MEALKSIYVNNLYARFAILLFLIEALKIAMAFFALMFFNPTLSSFEDFLADPIYLTLLLGPFLETVIFQCLVFGFLHKAYGSCVGLLVGGLIGGVAHGEDIIRHAVVFTIYNFAYFEFLKIGKKKEGILFVTLLHGSVNGLVMLTKWAFA